MSQSTDIRNARTLKRAQAAYDDRAEPDEPESSTSLQPLGDAMILVDFVLTSFGSVAVNGAWIKAEFVESHCFSKAVLETWRCAIQRETDSDFMGLVDCGDDWER
jgi:hypothetical protein